LKPPLDWTYLQTFFAVAEHGTLSAAARALGGSQPTMGRHISTLEHAFDVRLFERSASGLNLTETGIELLEHGAGMAAAAERFALIASGRSENIAGTVRITASDIVATFILPDILSALRQAEPEIDIELVATDRTENLLRREADIAVRMYRPTQNDVIARKVGDLAIGMYAAHCYLGRRGRPSSVADLKNHDVVGYDRSDLIIRAFAAGGMKIDRNFFAFRSDNQVVVWKMVIAGFGVGFNQRCIGDVDTRVERLELGREVAALPIWLTAHEELKTNRRVRRVYDFLADGLRNAGVDRS